MAGEPLILVRLAGATRPHRPGRTVSRQSPASRDVSSGSVGFTRRTHPDVPRTSRSPPPPALSRCRGGVGRSPHPRPPAATRRHALSRPCPARASLASGDARSGSYSLDPGPSPRGSPPSWCRGRQPAGGCDRRPLPGPPSRAWSGVLRRAGVVPGTPPSVGGASAPAHPVFRGLRVIARPRLSAAERGRTAPASMTWPGAGPAVPMLNHPQFGGAWPSPAGRRSVGSRRTGLVRPARRGGRGSGFSGRSKRPGIRCDWSVTNPPG